MNEDYRERPSFKKIHLTDTGLVHTGPCRLISITINQCTTAGTVTIYDDVAVSANILAIIGTQKDLAPQTLHYNCFMERGIYLEKSALGVTDFTVTWY